MLKEFIEKLKERKDREKNYENDLRIQKKVNDKMLSVEERELNEYMEEMRQRKIKDQVMKFRQMKKDEAFHQKQLMNTPNMFKEDKSKNLMNAPNMFKGKSSMMRNKSVMLK